MTYNLIAEFPWEPRWEKLESMAAKLVSVQCFPIPRDDLGGHALGISLPQKPFGAGAPNNNEIDGRGWNELEGFLLALWNDHVARVFDLYTGSEIRPETRAELKAALLDLR
jgi:hypothetical protein